MSPEEQRTAIAEACGWMNRSYQNQYGEPKTMWHHPNGAAVGDIPDYLNDLNAMHEAEKVLNNSKDGEAFGRTLADLVLGYHGTNETITLNYWALSRVARATAPQRAEAFLRTIGKWKKEARS